MFVMAFLLINKRHYAFDVIPQMQMLKFDFVGHDQLILHEHDLRRGKNDFAFLQVPSVRDAFMARVSEIVDAADFDLCATIIDKEKWRQKRRHLLGDPYENAVEICLESAANALVARGEAETEVTVVFEARGKNEDRQLELEFHRMVTAKFRLATGVLSRVVHQFKWNPLFVDKRSNSTGLQLADLFARPLGLAFLRPDQPNRAAQLLQNKMKRFPPKSYP